MATEGERYEKLCTFLEESFTSGGLERFLFFYDYKIVARTVNSQSGQTDSFRLGSLTYVVARRLGRIHVGGCPQQAMKRLIGAGKHSGGFALGSRIWASRGGAATDQEGVMSTDTQRGVAGNGEADADSPVDSTLVEYDPELARMFKEREVEIQRILAQRNPELIEQGIEAYKRDLPRLLAEDRYRQLVAYRGNELVAFGATDRQLKKRLAKKGFTTRGELFITCIAPLEIDEDDDVAP